MPRNARHARRARGAPVSHGRTFGATRRRAAGLDRRHHLELAEASAAAPLALSPNWPDWLSATVKGIEARIDPRTERTAARKQGSVAVIPVFGVIMPRPLILEYYGLTISTQRIGQHVREAVADPDVQAIMLDVGSPGGAVSGLSELAAGLRGAKPIVAHADYLVASAAYWVAAQAR